jgi:hypothetical protein
MKYPVEMGSDAMVFVPCFIMIGSDIQELIGGYTDTQTAWCSQNPIFIFSLCNLHALCVSVYPP